MFALLVSVLCQSYFQNLIFYVIISLCHISFIKTCTVLLKYHTFIVIFSYQSSWIPCSLWIINYWHSILKRQGSILMNGKVKWEQRMKGTCCIPPIGCKSGNYDIPVRRGSLKSTESSTTTRTTTTRTTTTSKMSHTTLIWLQTPEGSLLFLPAWLFEVLTSMVYFCSLVLDVKRRCETTFSNKLFCKLRFIKEISDGMPSMFRLSEVWARPWYWHAHKPSFYHQ